jgi:DNA-directed RNA polymerase subunit K
MQKEGFSRYEISRILGARALQIAMNAPLLIKLSKEQLEEINFDPLKIAELEFESDILPISVNRPLPEKREEKLKRLKETVSEQKIEEKKAQEEEDIAKEGEIMELANPEDEQDDEDMEDSGGEE